MFLYASSFLELNILVSYIFENIWFTFVSVIFLPNIHRKYTQMMYFLNVKIIKMLAEMLKYVSRKCKKDDALI